MSFFDSGAFWDVISMALCQKRHLNQSPTKRRITIIDKKEGMVVGEVTQEPVKIDPLTTQISCLIAHATPYDLIIGRPLMKLMRASLDFDKDVVNISAQKGGDAHCTSH